MVINLDCRYVEIFFESIVINDSTSSFNRIGIDKNPALLSHEIQRIDNRIKFPDLPIHGLHTFVAPETFFLAQVYINRYFIAE